MNNVWFNLFLNLLIAWTGEGLYKMMLCKLLFFYYKFCIHIKKEWKHVNIKIKKNSCITNIQVKNMYLSEEGGLIGCTWRLKDKHNEKHCNLKWKDWDQMALMADGRSSSIKAKQDKRSMQSKQEVFILKDEVQGQFEHERCGGCYRGKIIHKGL